MAAWLCANLCVHALESLPGPAALSAVFVSAALFAAVLRHAWPVAFAAGFLWTAVVARHGLEQRLAGELEGLDVQVSGWIDDFPETFGNRTRLTLRVTEARAAALLGARIRVTWYDAEFTPRPAQRLDLTVRLRRPHGFANPAGFDYERWLLRERIAATGYVRVGTPSASLQPGFAPRLLAMRSHLRERIAAAVAGAPAAALITALSIGDRSGFADQQWSVFRRTGTSHLVAISGLHIGIVAACVAWIVARAATLNGRRGVVYARAVSGIAALLAAVAYAALAGFSVSTLRAVVMFASALLIFNMSREVSRMHGFALAALIVVVLDPLVTLGNSFWLSFGAVATLLAATSARPLAARGSRFATAAAVALRVQLCLVLMSMPASALMFGEISLAALPVNLIAVPIFGFLLVPLVLLGVFAELSIGAAQPLWHVCGWLAGAVMNAMQFAAQLPAASFELVTPSLPAALLAIAGVVLATVWHSGTARSISALAVLPLLFPKVSLLPEGAFRLTVLDVGHGLASIIETRSHRIVFDAGARFASGFDIGRDVVVPELRARGKPDILIVSHADNDHSGGAGALTSTFPDVSVIGGPDVELAGARRCVAGQRWRFDGVAFEFLHPAVGFRGSGNDGSCVLKVVAPGGSALLTGDIERAGEAAVIAGGQADVDIVVAPHHGSATSSSARFVAATSPRIAVFSAGYGNRWNFPVADVVARWCAAGATVYVTGDQGAVEMLIGSGISRASAGRDVQRRYWTAYAAPRCGESHTVTL